MSAAEGSAKSIVFHHPLPIDTEPAVGSTTHVTNMLAAFQSLGYEVELVAGYSSQRRRAAAHVIDQVRRGRKFDFIFGEAATTPTALNDRHHVPLHPWFDVALFRAMRRRGVPSGVFYPDVHWRFPFYRDALRPPKRWVTSTFYRYDLAWYSRYVDILFVPHTRMRWWIPGWERRGDVRQLTPGGSYDLLDWKPAEGRLKLFYVGGVDPPLYDISPLLAAVDAAESVSLTVCCPEDNPMLREVARRNPRIEVIHGSGQTVVDGYADCDASCIVYEDELYRYFTMPVKLYESISAGRPVVASAGTSAGDFVAASGLGWAPAADQLVGLLSRLAGSPGEIERVRQQVIAARAEHTWTQRARLVADALVAVSRPGGAEDLRRRRLENS